LVDRISACRREDRVHIAALIVAAGRGERAGGALPKQYVPLAGTPMLAHALSRFLDHPGIGQVLTVAHPDDMGRYEAAAPRGHGKLLAPCEGGATRQASVLNGLEALASHAPDRVLIHDAARPLVEGAVLDRVLGALDRHVGAVPVIGVADTLKRVDASGLVTETVAREGLWRVQTPQGFHFAPILAAHRMAAAAGRADFTDDAAVAAWHGMEVAAVEGSARNRKLTTAEDMAMAERELAHA
jgi:2-C-methyl-D-erythritol 4-phosphate cytidylyltransferase/2-C-methyl-D-erythritol 2,4-cyclodiphosphate synthase